MNARKRDQPRFELEEAVAQQVQGTIVGMVGDSVWVQVDGSDCAIPVPLSGAPGPAIGAVRLLEVVRGPIPGFIRWVGPGPRGYDDVPGRPTPPPPPSGIPAPGQPLPLAHADTAALRGLLRGILDPHLRKGATAPYSDLMYLVRRAHGQGMSRRD